MAGRSTLCFLGRTSHNSKVHRLLAILFSAWGRTLIAIQFSRGTYLAPKMESIMMTEDLIEQRAIMLQKQPQDLQQVREQVLKSRWEAVKQLKKMKKNNIVDFNFEPRLLVIVNNTKFYKTPVGQD